MEKPKMSSEKLVKEFLEERGFAVSLRISKDNKRTSIVAIKHLKAYSIDVKTCATTNNSIIIKPISEAGLSCDLLAIVTPRKNIIFQPMKDHVNLMAKNGSRVVTKLVRLYDSF